MPSLTTGGVLKGRNVGIHELSEPVQYAYDTAAAAIDDHVFNEHFTKSATGHHNFNGAGIDGEYAYLTSAASATVTRVHLASGASTVKPLYIEFDADNSVLGPNDMTLDYTSGLYPAPFSQTYSKATCWVDDAVIVGNRLYMSVLWFDYIDMPSSGAIPFTMAGTDPHSDFGGMIYVDLGSSPDDFATAEVHLIAKRGLWTNPVSSDGSVVVFATAFGGNLVDPADPRITSVVTVVDPMLSPPTLRASNSQFSITYPAGHANATKPAYTNNFAVTGGKMLAVLSDSGPSVAHPAGLWIKGTSFEWAEISIADDATFGELRILEHVPASVGYALSVKYIAGRTFILSEFSKIFERSVDGDCDICPGTYTLVDDIAVGYGAKGPDVPLAAHFSFGDYSDQFGLPFGPTAFADNMFVSLVGDNIHISVSIGLSIYSVVVAA